MCQECSLGPHPTGKVHGIIHILVRVMIRFETQGIHHQDVWVHHKGQLTVVYRLHIRDIHQVLNAEPGDGQLVVIHAEGNHLQLVYLNRLMVL